MQRAFLEYVLFAPRWAEVFVEFLDRHKIPSRRESTEEAVIIFVPEDLSDDMDALIEEEYDRIMAAHEQEESSSDATNRVGIQYHNSAGEICQARMDMDLVNRILTVITLEELQTFIQLLVDEFESGGKSRLCER